MYEFGGLTRATAGGLFFDPKGLSLFEFYVSIKNYFYSRSAIPRTRNQVIS